MMARRLSVIAIPVSTCSTTNVNMIARSLVEEHQVRLNSSSLLWSSDQPSSKFYAQAYSSLLLWPSTSLHRTGLIRIPTLSTHSAHSISMNKLSSKSDRSSSHTIITDSSLRSDSVVFPHTWESVMSLTASL